MHQAHEGNLPPYLSLPLKIGPLLYSTSFRRRQNNTKTNHNVRSVTLYEMGGVLVFWRVHASALQDQNTNGSDETDIESVRFLNTVHLCPLHTVIASARGIAVIIFMLAPQHFTLTAWSSSGWTRANWAWLPRNQAKERGDEKCSKAPSLCCYHTVSCACPPL